MHVSTFPHGAPRFRLLLHAGESAEPDDALGRGVVLVAARRGCLANRRGLENVGDPSHVSRSLSPRCKFRLRRVPTLVPGLVVVTETRWAAGGRDANLFNSLVFGSAGVARAICLPNQREMLIHWRHVTATGCGVDAAWRGRGRSGGGLHALLGQLEEDHPYMARPAAVEAERELVQVGSQMLTRLPGATLASTKATKLSAENGLRGRGRGSASAGAPRLECRTITPKAPMFCILLV